MRYASITDRLSGLGSGKWALHLQARAMAASGIPIIELTIGEPDLPPDRALLDEAARAMYAGRIKYSNGRGEPAVLEALVEKYRARRADVTEANILCFPGTQTALYAVLMGLAEPGAEVLVGDPMYATYEAVIRAGGATPVPVPLRAERGFRLAAEDLAARVTPRSRAILLNTPHNPTGAVLTPADLGAIGEVARAHDLWIVSDEVYEELVFDGTPFASPFDRTELADRTVAVSSISKSHAAPGFRSGWAVSSADCADRLLPLSETMLFGNQPFIADMTAGAVAAPSAVAAGMRARFAARARYLADRLAQETALRVHRPDAGMFALVDVTATGMDDTAYAMDLLEATGVAVMPGTSFGESLAGWVRVALTVDDTRFRAAADRIVAHAAAPKARARARA